VNQRPGQPRDHVFVLRLWAENAPPTAAWRAQITHVASSERRYFTNYGELCEFLDRYHGGQAARAALD
jgi:hypothetical protein